MGQTIQIGQIIILNGTSRSGKSSIVAAIQETLAEILGVRFYSTDT